METVGFSDLMTMMASFVVVIGLLVLTLFAIKKYGTGMSLSGDRQIEIIEVRNIGARQKLLLVSVKSEKIHIGVTASGMTKLGQWDLELDAHKRVDADRIDPV